MLQRLSTDGVRFMVLNFAHWEHAPSITADINFWMPLLEKYHMWTFIHLQADYDANYPDLLNTSIQLPRQLSVIQELSANPAWANMVIAWVIAWELDAGAFGFTDADVTAYLQNVTPIIKGYLSNSAIGSVPIVNKPQGHWSDNRGRVPMGLYADLLGSDYYATVTASGSGVYASAVATQESILQTTYMTQTNKAGHAVWHTEWGIQNGLLNGEITPALFTQVLDEYGYHNCGGIWIWLMWNSASYEFAAFNPDGTAKQWYIDIAPILKNLVTPEQFTVQILPAANGVTVPTGTLIESAGDTIQIAAVANAGFMLDYWDVNAVQSTANPLLLTVTKNTTVQAYFKAVPSFTITLTCVADAGGTVSPSGANVLTIGTQYTFAAIPENGKVFDYWNLNGTDQGSVNPLNLLVTAAMNNMTLTAYFKDVSGAPDLMTLATIGSLFVAMLALAYSAGVGKS